MTDDNGIRDEKPELGETEQGDPSITRRVPRHTSGDEERVPETGHEATPPPSGGIVQQIWRRIQEDRHRGGGHPPTPATPPCVRVRTRRFESVTLTVLEQ
jgi:hypothetical protein